MSAVAFRHLRESSVPCHATKVAQRCKCHAFRRLTVRMCFLRMYKKKLHNLEVTPRKVRTPSRHWRVFSMSTIPPESVRCDLHRRQEQYNTPVEIRPCQPFTASPWSVPMRLAPLDRIQINAWRAQKCSDFKKKVRV